MLTGADPGLGGGGSCAELLALWAVLVEIVSAALIEALAVIGWSWY